MRYLIATLIVAAVGIAAIAAAYIWFVRIEGIWSGRGLFIYALYVGAHIVIAVILFQPWVAFR